MLLKPRPIVCVRSFVSMDLELTVTAARRLRAGLVTNSVTITLAKRSKLRSRVQSARNPSVTGKNAQRRTLNRQSRRRQDRLSATSRVAGRYRKVAGLLSAPVQLTQVQVDNASNAIRTPAALNVPDNRRHAFFAN